MSMVEELMSLVNKEEYVDVVPALSDDEYLTKTELASVCKMVSGKLWIDTRRFKNWQNQCILTGMYKLFGHCVSKSVLYVHAEMSQYFLDPDRKKLRDTTWQHEKQQNLIQQMDYKSK